VLSVGKSATDDDLKKAYRKFSLKLHPDKNHAPKASDAFKKVSAAYSCLTDKEKRRVYDMTGSDPGNNANNSQQQRTRQRSTEVNPEEIFNMFFGGDVFG